MKKNLKMNIINGALIASVLSLVLAASASAATTATTTRMRSMHIASSTQQRLLLRQERQASSTQARASSTQARMDNRIANEQERGADMLTQRIMSLGSLINRIQGMNKISDTDKTSIINSLRLEVSNLINLKNSIASTTSTTTLKSEIDSITKSNRVYALVEPQANIMGAAGRIQGVVRSLNIIYTKINSRLASSSVLSSSTITSVLSDFKAQVSDATNQASSSIAEVSGLTPDNGNKTIAASNTAALKDARSKIATAQKDLNNAEKDIRTVVGAILNRGSQNQ